MTIRQATLDDLEAAADLLGAQNRAAVGVAGVRVEFLRADWDAPGRDSLVAEVDGRIVGYASKSPQGELTLAASDDTLADDLLDRIVKRARESGDAMLTLVVPTAESPLANLAERHPFELSARDAPDVASPRRPRRRARAAGRDHNPHLPPG
jgi:hypothetical protein